MPTPSILYDADSSSVRLHNTLTETQQEGMDVMKVKTCETVKDLKGWHSGLTSVISLQGHNAKRWR